MTKIIKHISFLITGVVMMFACDKINLANYEAAKAIDLEKKAQVRFIHAFSSNAINTVTPVVITTPPPPFNFFVNGQRLNGLTLAATSPSNLIFYFGAFPGVNTTAPTTNGSNGSLNIGGVAASTILPDYAVIPGGITRVAAVLNRVTGATAADSLIAATFNFENGKKYSVITADTLPFQRLYRFEDNWTVPTPGNYQIRFINLAPNVTINSFDIFSRRRGGYILTDLPYRSATTYIESSVIGTLGLTNDTLELRSGGTPTILAQFNGFFPVSQRVYTFVIRGMSNLPSSNVRSLAMSGYLNR